jgi:hypothetical protein
MGQNFMGKTQVGIEFIYPAPEFWGSGSTPEDAKNLEPNRS